MSLSTIFQAFLKMPLYKPKNRISFDVDQEVLDQIDDLVILTGAESRADLFRNSLRLFAWWIKQQNAGYDVILRKDGEEDTVVELKRA